MKRHVPLLLFAFALVVGCSDNNENNENNKNNTNNTNNTTKDMTVDMPVETDMTADIAPDMPVKGDPCKFSTECNAGEICLDEFCYVAPDCTGAKDWGICGVKLEKIKAGSLNKAICDAGKCKIACTLDSPCADGQVCGDDGICIDFPSKLTGKHPGGDARTRIKVGVSNTLLNVPIGINAAGYGGGGNIKGRYVEAMSPSSGVLHGLYNRAIAMDNGERQLIFLRSPLVFPTAPLHEAIAQKLQEKTGADWRDSLVISGTHTHSGPGRFLHLPLESSLPLGPLGTDLFHQQVFDWVSESLSETAISALDDLEEGSLGWTIVEGFDTDDEISSDRWGATPKFDDNRALFIRLDDKEGKPKAVLMSFGMHGTWNSDRPYLTEDAAGSVERALENAMGQEFGKHVPTLFFNSSGGTMSPRGDRKGHAQSHKFDYMGLKFVEKVYDDIKNITMKEDIDLGGATHRFPISHESLGYKTGEFVDIRGRKEDLRYGGLQCTVAGVEDDDYATHAPTDKVSCLGIHSIMYNRPPTIFVRSQVSAFAIDGLTIVTLPGEPAMEIGWQVLREVRDKLNVDPLKAFVFGYAQDHKFYMVPDNLRGELPPFPGISLPMAPDDYPDYAISYFQGGYEAGFMPWGHKFAPFLAERVTEAVAKLQGTPLTMKLPEVLPIYYSRRNDGTFEIDVSSADIGKVVTDMPAVVERLKGYEFAWVGGDPGAEMPQTPYLVLEKEQMDGSFKALVHKNMRPYDNREPLFVTRMRKVNADWEWVVYWEELKNFEAGNYRFNVSGHYQSAEGRKPYTLTSSTFAVGATNSIMITPAFDNATRTMSGVVGYAPAQKLNVIGPNDDTGKVEGSFRLRHPDVPTGFSDPVIRTDKAIQTLTIEVSQNNAVVETFTVTNVTTAPETVAGRANVPVTRFTQNMSSLARGTYSVKFSIKDQWDNTGTLTTDVLIP